ncbi:MAG: aminopeptidase [Woeseia sp.]
MVPVASGLFVLLLAVQIEGCYYMQAARGHVDIMQKRRPVDDVIRDASSPEELKERLIQVKEARQFSIDELRLPDNDSYLSYAELDRDFVVWNVFAAPEFSLQAKRWCYPVVGCVGYRGYFSKEAAQKRAEKLRRDGYDVVVGGVAAYSTLGRFSDPVLSTMMRWSDLDLVAVLFHELAHQKLYVRDDAEFNESFATAVEEIGIERWLASRGEHERLREYRGSREFRRLLMQHVRAARAELEKLYASLVDDDQKRERKQTILARLTAEAHREVDRKGRRAPVWLMQPMNNASLIPLILYQGKLAEFRQLLKDCHDDLQCFYDGAETLSRS